MELQQLRCFVAAAETESFTRGAQRVFISQPALSAAISKLEAEMDVKLFTRNKRNVVLTPAGRKLLKRARLIIGECSKAKEELRQHDIERSLRVGVINTLPINKVALMIEQYRRENPELNLEVIDASAADLQRLEQQGRIDLALTVINHGQPQPSPKMFRNRAALFVERYKLAVPQEHHLSRSKQVPLESLSKEAFIVRSHCEHRRIVQACLKQAQVTLNIHYITSQDDRAIALVSSGNGVAIIPEHYDAPGIVKLDLNLLELEREVGVEWGESDREEEIRRFVVFSQTVAW